MKKKRGIKKRFRQLQYDVRGIMRAHGPKILVLYLVVKVLTKIPWVSSVFKKICHGKLLVRMRILHNWMYLNFLDPGISYQLIVHGIRERGHVEQIQSALQRGMKGIDLGANIGYYVLLESRLIGPEGHIYCIEPAPDNIALLRKNIHENNFDDRTTCFQYLAGEKSGLGKLFLSSAANSHSVSAISDRFVELPMVTIDHFLAAEHIDPSEIDFLRMDIEGYEIMVLQHMDTLLTQRTKPLKLFIELHPASFEQWGWTLERVLEYIMNLGFVVRSVVHENVKDERGNVTDKLVEAASASELAAKYREWERMGTQDGILAFFELPVHGR
jgi:FkbM family methyltransferase